MEARKLQDSGCIYFFSVCFFVTLPLGQVYARCETWLAQPVAIEGKAQVMRKDEDVWLTLNRGDVLCQGDLARVLANSRVTLEMPNQTIARLDEHTTVEFVGDQEPVRSWLDMVQGFVHFISRVPRSLTIKTPYMNAVVEGTEFLVSVTDDESSVVVFEGVVAASNAFGQVNATAGQAIIASRDRRAPVILAVVNPWDAVRWALYYPPLLSLSAGDVARLSAPEREAFQRATVAAQSGETHEALRLLVDLKRQSPLLVYRASLFLSVGRVDEARRDVDGVLSLSPDDGNALALKSIIATVQNDRELALAAAMEAVGHASELAAPRLALSYAWQSRFELERARGVLEEAVERIRDNSLLWARLAEVRLMFREFNSALDAVQTATALEPNNAHAKTILGFAHLLRMKTEVARQTFEEAIILDPGAPLSRLGHGLALIRDGKLTEGRRQLEIAIALDPSSALNRSYLGKAYYEEKRNSLAAGQFELAKDLDPNDPTAWFYDAIRKQTENRPVEALYDLEQSIEKNDNRAVYRSQLLLDDDTASRNASLARVYHDLGFEELALLEGWKSLNKNPANHSAHRLLADVYRGQSRDKFAGFSELLQSQMLAPAGLNPLSSTQNDFSITGDGDMPDIGSLAGGSNDFLIALNYGSSAVGLNEFSGLYTRDGIVVQTSGLVGPNATFGEEVIVSGLEGETAFSVSQLHLESDGYRPNADFRTDLFNAFVQHDFSPMVSVQMEARRKLRKNGDVRQFVNDGNFSLELEQERTDNNARVGVRVSPKHNNHFLFSAGWGKFDFGHDDVIDFGSGAIIDVHLGLEGDGYNYEFQNILTYDNVRWVWGFAYDRGDARQRAVIALSIVGFELPLFELELEEKWLSEHSAAYFYSNIDLNRSHNLTIGGGIDQHRDFARDFSQFNPKLGWMWSPTDATSIRAAVFRTMRRSLFLAQTLEPTQVSGFTQIFSEDNGTDASVYAAAIDQRLGLNASLGLEALRRRSETPTIFLDDPEVLEEDRQEQRYKAYFNYIFSKQWVYALNYEWNRIGKRFLSRDITSPTDPMRLKTEVLNMSLSYSHPVGLLTRLDMHYVSQTSRFHLESGDMSVNEKFPVVDYEIGFRLPKRRGSINFVVRNVFDNSFSTQQGPFFSVEPLIQRYYPEQAFFVRFDFLFQ